MADVVRMHVAGISKKRIAGILNERGTLTPSGRPRWTASHVWTLLGTTTARDMKDALLTAT